MLTRIVGDDRRGTSALEFALLAPALIVIALSLYDVTSAVIAWWQMAAGAHAIGLIATNLAATPSLTNVLSAKDAGTASTAIYAVRPSLAGGGQQFGVTVSSIVFTAPSGCSANCTYTASVAWSAALQGSAAARPCGPLVPAPDGSPPSPGTLPADAFSPAPLLLVDVTYRYVPLLTSPFAASFPIRESAYFAPRTGSNAAWVRYTGANAAQVQCPGYVG